MMCFDVRKNHDFYTENFERLESLLLDVQSGKRERERESKLEYITQA